MRTPIHRRTVLRGAGISIALPLLDAMRPRRASAQVVPRRFLTWFTTNGTIAYAWNCVAADAEIPLAAVGTYPQNMGPAVPPPPKNETDFKLNRILAPMERHRKQMIVIQNVDLAGKGYAHGNTTLHQLTGRKHIAVDGGQRATGISLDQELANTIGRDSKFPSLQLGCVIGPNNKKNEGTLSFTAAGDGLVSQDNVYESFDRLFGDFSKGTDPMALDRLRMLRKSVLDSIKENAATFERQLGAHDKAKVEQHLTSIREIETKLDTKVAPAGRCAVPAVDGGMGGGMSGMLDWKKNSNVPQILKIQMDLIAMAFACDLTRVISFMVSRDGGGGRSHTWVPDGAGDWHAVSHQGDKGDSRGWEKQVQVNIWYHQQLAYLLDRMKEIKEDDRTLLDNSVVWATNEYGNGVMNDSHYHERVPFLLLGSCGGYFKTGRCLIYPRQTMHNGILVAIARAMGRPIDTFGDAPASGPGPLKGLAA